MRLNINGRDIEVADSVGERRLITSCARTST